MIYVFARLWRRAEILTDNELTEIRYGGHPAAVLRATKGFLFAVVIGALASLAIVDSHKWLVRTFRQLSRKFQAVDLKDRVPGLPAPRRSIQGVTLTDNGAFLIQ